MLQCIFYMKRIQQDSQTSIYHCLSRTVHGERWLDEHGKAVFCKILHKMAKFSGIRVLTYCVMSNHFHLLLEVPKKEDRLKIPDAELLCRFRLLYGEEGTDYMPISAAKLEAYFNANDARAQSWRKCLHERMHDLPLFMKLVKHRFTKWYNLTHKTYGTFWAERYTSLLVEPDGEVLRKIACYIDLNPVRAGLVEDPSRYPWSGYGAACMGDYHQRDAISDLSAYGGKTDPSSFEAYEQELYWRGSFEVEGPGKGGIIPQVLVNQKINQQHICQKKKGFVYNMAQILKHGCVYGSHSFVQGNAEWVRRRLGRKKTARPIQKEANEAPCYLVACRD
jgi:putative transposase